MWTAVRRASGLAGLAKMRAERRLAEGFSGKLVNKEISLLG